MKRVGANRPKQETMKISALATTHIEVIKIEYDSFEIIEKRSEMIIAFARFKKEIGLIALKYDKEFYEDVLKPTFKAYKIIESKEPKDSYKQLIHLLT